MQRRPCRRKRSHTPGRTQPPAACVWVGGHVRSGGGGGASLVLSARGTCGTALAAWPGNMQPMLPRPCLRALGCSLVDLGLHPGVPALLLVLCRARAAGGACRGARRAAAWARAKGQQQAWPTVVAYTSSGRALYSRQPNMQQQGKGTRRWRQRRAAVVSLGAPRCKVHAPLGAAAFITSSRALLRHACRRDGCMPHIMPGCLSLSVRVFHGAHRPSPARRHQ